jgi:hypothetical protein
MLQLGSEFTGIILIQFHPYKIIVMHELKQPDYASVFATGYYKMYTMDLSL